MESNVGSYLDSLKMSLSDKDKDLLTRAYEKSEEMHKGQFRRSGQDYFVHPKEVGKILADLGMDAKTIAAALLHDAVEDTPYSLDQLEKDFGKEVAILVDGVTKLGSLVFESKEEQQAENLRKMFLAMSKDIRVLIIKLADRLHNMRTLNYMTEDKILEKSRETLEIYAHLADRLGIYKIKFELEDIAFRYIDKEKYDELYVQVEQKKKEREEYVIKAVDLLKENIDALDIKYDIKTRTKHYYSIYRKMKFQYKQIEEIFDLIGVRITVESIKDCYAVLGIAHTLWKPIPGRFKDYIAMPKANMYQSLHTTVFGTSGQPFEIQIRTYDMNKTAEYGIAAHWKYKEGVDKYQDENKLAWLRQTLEWQNDVNDSQEFLETLKMDLFSNQVFVFTPKGTVIELPAGSTPLDFAFKIHTEIGAKCVGAKINGKIVPLDYELVNGNIIDIMTSSNSKGPNIDWLKIVKSTHTKNKIRQWLKKENRGENIEKGKDILERYIKRKGYEPAAVMKSNWVNKTAKVFSQASADDLYTTIGYGGLLVNKVAGALLEYYLQDKQDEVKKIEKAEKTMAEAEVDLEAKKKPRKKEASGVKVKGVDNLLIRFSKCCTPVPGDDIVGFITKGRGISVHRSDCVNVLHTPEGEKGRFLPVEWDIEKEHMKYDMEINIIAEDRKGLFAEISRILDEIDIDISSINARSSKDKIVTMALFITVNDVHQMEKAISKLITIYGVKDVYRM